MLGVIIRNSEISLIMKRMNGGNSSFLGGILARCICLSTEKIICRKNSSGTSLLSPQIGSLRIPEFRELMCDYSQIYKRMESMINVPLQAGYRIAQGPSFIQHIDTGGGAKDYTRVHSVKRGWDVAHAL